MSPGAWVLVGILFLGILAGGVWMTRKVLQDLERRKAAARSGRRRSR